MDQNRLFARDRVDSVRVVESGSWINPDMSDSGVRIEMNVELTGPVVQRSEERGENYSDMVLGLTVQYLDDTMSMAPRARFNVKVMGRVATPDAGGSTSDVEKAIRTVAINQLFPQAQAYVTMLAGMSQMSGVSVPMINTKEFVEQISTGKGSLS